MYKYLSVKETVKELIRDSAELLHATERGGLRREQISEFLRKHQTLLHCRSIIEENSLLHAAVTANDVIAVAELLEAEPGLRDLVNKEGDSPVEQCLKKRRSLGNKIKIEKRCRTSPIKIWNKARVENNKVELMHYVLNGGRFERSSVDGIGEVFFFRDFFAAANSCYYSQDGIEESKTAEEQIRTVGENGGFITPSLFDNFAFFMNRLSDAALNRKPGPKRIIEFGAGAGTFAANTVKHFRPQSYETKDQSTLLAAAQSEVMKSAAEEVGIPANNYRSTKIPSIVDSGFPKPTDEQRVMIVYAHELPDDLPHQECRIKDGVIYVSVFDRKLNKHQVPLSSLPQDCQLANDLRRVAPKLTQYDGKTLYIMTDAERVRSRLMDWVEPGGVVIISDYHKLTSGPTDEVRTYSPFMGTEECDGITASYSDDTVMIGFHNLTVDPDASQLTGKDEIPERFLEHDVFMDSMAEYRAVFKRDLRALNCDNREDLLQFTKKYLTTFKFNEKILVALDKEERDIVEIKDILHRAFEQLMRKSETVFSYQSVIVLRKDPVPSEENKDEKVSEGVNPPYKQKGTYPIEEFESDLEAISLDNSDRLKQFVRTYFEPDLRESVCRFCKSFVLQNQWHMKQIIRWMLAYELTAKECSELESLPRMDTSKMMLDFCELDMDEKFDIEQFIDRHFTPEWAAYVSTELEELCFYETPPELIQYFLNTTLLKQQLWCAKQGLDITLNEDELVLNYLHETARND